MKVFYKTLLLLTVTIFITATIGNAQSVWAKAMNGSDNTSGASPSSMKLDAAGNIYVTGFYHGTVDFDPGAGTQNLSVVNTIGIFVSKYDKLVTWYG